ncbi:substance-K receptor-like [Orbicella faveolata]|uniref:substance-K receptor-like n=1 Tax=Orbicella faveolata TaxID=48498 RepID=UPI0009E5533D|nr:substance-K receptor-like [Orbicella faveolata]
MSLSECITWVTVGLAESVAIVTLNLCTIIVFIKNRNLRKRSTYLVINLAVIDMLAGGSAVYDFYRVGADCNVWKSHSIDGWVRYILYVLLLLFPISSLSNITIIALERMHATFWPLRHRVLKKSAYGIIIAVVWVTAGLTTITHILLDHFGKLSDVYFYLRISLAVMCLLIIFVSYVFIVIKVRCGAQPRHHGPASRERKLTMTLLIVTVVSLLLYLPFNILYFLIFITKSEILLSLSPSESFCLFSAIFALFYANHLVNPILYAIRMPEYRSALLALFRKRPQ